jgi:hypothetical protein
MASFVTESKLTVQLFCSDFVDLVSYWNQNLNTDRPFKNIEAYESEYGITGWKLQWRSRTVAERFASALQISTAIEHDSGICGQRRWSTVLNEKQIHDLFRNSIIHYLDLPPDTEVEVETVEDYNFIVPSHFSASFHIDGKLAESINFKKLFVAEQNLCWLKS